MVKEEEAVGVCGCVCVCVCVRVSEGVSVVWGVYSLYLMGRGGCVYVAYITSWAGLD